MKIQIKLNKLKVKNKIYLMKKIILNKKRVMKIKIEKLYIYKMKNK